MSLEDAPAKLKNTLPDLKKLKDALLANISAQLGIHSIASLDATVGMAIDVKNGSGIYTAIQGDLSHLMQIALNGDLLFKLDDPYITSNGKCELDACKHRILECDYTLAGGRFDIRGTLNSDFLEEIEDEVANLVQDLVSFDEIKDAVNDVAKKTGIVKVRQTAVSTAKSAFDDAKKSLDIANSGFEKAKSGLDSADHILKDAMHEVNSAAKHCDDIPSSIYIGHWGVGFHVPNPAYHACVLVMDGLKETAKAALSSAREGLSVAKGTLRTAQKTLSAAKSAFNLAKKALDAANSALALAQKELQKAMDIESALEKKVGAAVFKVVKEVTKFSLNFASLDKTTMKGSMTNDSVGFSLALTIKVMGQTVSLPKVSLNIHDPISGTAQDIAKQVIHKIT